MRSFQAVFAFLVAAMVNMAFASSGIHATAMVLACSLVDAALCSGLQHAVVASGRHGLRKVLYPRVNHTAGCFHESTFPPTEGDNSTLVPWTALANENDPASEIAIFDTVASLCKRMSTTILTRDIPYTHCEPDKYTNGTYGIIAQIMYLGPQDIYDMRGNYELCMGAISLPGQCTYGGLFEEVELWKHSPNDTQLWNVQARPILGRCPDCTGGLIA